MKQIPTLHHTLHPTCQRAGRRRAAIVSGALVGGLVLSSCSGPADDAERSITWWATNQSTTVARDEAILGAAIDRFTEQTGIEVELEVVPWADLYSKILAAVSSGEGPDVVNIGNTWAVTLQQTGAFLPIEGELLEAVGGSERFVDTSWAASGLPDEVPTSVPLLAQTYALYYNPEHFAAAGVTAPPATWAEFVDIAQQLTTDTDGDGTTDRWGVALTAGAVTTGAHFAFILGQQHGADWFDAAGEPQLDAPGMVDAVAAYVGLLGADGVAAPSDAENERGGDATEQFIAGDASMIIVQSPRAQFDLAGFTSWRMAEVPVVEPAPPGGRPIQSHVAGTNVSIFTDSDEPEAATEFVRFLTSVPEQQYLNSSYSTLPVVHDAYDDDYLADDASAELSRGILVDHSEPFPLSSRTGQAETLIGTVVKTLMARAATDGSISIDDVRRLLADAQSQLVAAG